MLKRLSAAFQIVCAGALSALAALQSAHAASPSPTPICNKEAPGVLIDCTISNSETPLVDYIVRVLNQNTGYIIALAVILVIWSGIEYIYSFGDTGKQAAAKKRIIEIVTGIIVYTLIFFMIRIISGDLNLN